jgi:hypothetical protein
MLTAKFTMTSPYVDDTITVIESMTEDNTFRAFSESGNVLVTGSFIEGTAQKDLENQINQCLSILWDKKSKFTIPIEEVINSGVEIPPNTEGDWEWNLSTCDEFYDEVTPCLCIGYHTFPIKNMNGKFRVFQYEGYIFILFKESEDDWGFETEYETFATFRDM